MTAPKLTLELLEELLTDELGEHENLEALLWEARDENMGLCRRCHAVAYGVEPDARRVQCEECMEHAVYGIEEISLRLMA